MSSRRKKESSSSLEGISPEKAVKQEVKRRKKMAATGGTENDNNVTLNDLQGQLHAIMGSLQIITNEIKTVKNKHTELDQDIHGDGGINDLLEEARATIGETQADVCSTQELLQDNVKTIQMLTSVVLKQNQQLNSLQSEVDDLKARSMRENILIHNVPEDDSQGVRNAAVKALARVNIDISSTEFDRIHRLGPVRSDKSSRPIVAKPHKFRETDRLLNVDKRGLNRKTQPWISPQYPEQIREARIQLSMIAEEKKKLSPNVKIKINHTTLLVNNSIVKPSLTPPSPAEILTLEKQEKEELKNIKFVKGAQVNTKSSSFVAQATHVKNLNQVRNAYKATMLDPAAAQATHNIAAYILPGGSSGYCDDRDYGLGRRALQVMQSLNSKQQQLGIAIFISRQYGGTKLGTQRFDIVRDITTEVCKKLQNLQAHDSLQILTPSVPAAPGHTDEHHSIIEAVTEVDMEQEQDISISTTAPLNITEDVGGTS